MNQFTIPEVQGLYNPANEHDNCGIGFVAHIKGIPSHEIIRRGLDVLLNMDHRGATSADNSSGDGAGLLMQIPHEFITQVLKMNVGLPGRYGTGLIFLPTIESEAEICLEVLTKNIRKKAWNSSGTAMYRLTIRRPVKLPKRPNLPLNRFSLKASSNRMPSKENFL